MPPVARRWSRARRAPTSTRPPRTPTAIYKANLTYQATEDALVYATFSQGFRPGGINRRGTLPPYGAGHARQLRRSAGRPPSGRSTSTRPVYQLDWKNIQLSFLGPNGLTEIRNAGIARIRGVELATGYSAGGLTVNLSGSINDAKTRRDFCKFAVEADPFDCSLSAPDSQTDDDLAARTERGARAGRHAAAGHPDVQGQRGGALRIPDR